MNAIEVLKKDHQEVQRLFSEFMSVDEEDFARREDLFQEIDTALTAHSEAEEQVFYPLLKNEAPDLVKQAISDHQNVKQLLMEMLDLEVDDEEFDNKMNTLMQEVQNHVQEEESPGGILDIAGQTLSEPELEDIGKRIQQRKDESEEELAA